MTTPHEIDVGRAEVTFVGTAATEVLQTARESVEGLGGQLCVHTTQAAP